MRLLAVLAGLAIVGSTASSGQLWPGFERQTMLACQIRSGRSYLGVSLADIDDDRAKVLRLADGFGVEITNIQDGCPAQKAGLKIGDVLLTFNGQNILGAQQLGRLVLETPPGRKVKIQYWRDGRRASTTAATGSLEFQNDGPLDLPFSVSMPSVIFSEIPSAMIVWRTPSLGLECEPLGAQLAEFFSVKHGALVRGVDPESPAEKAGIKAGDVLVSIGDRSVAGPRDIASFFRTLREPGKSVSLTLVRKRKEMTFSLPVVPRSE